jgi:hypothetical protein
MLALVMSPLKVHRMRRDLLKLSFCSFPRVLLGWKLHIMMDVEKMCGVEALLGEQVG